MTNGILNSWKEIASYVGRGVRTVQRWERDLSFPVFRTNDRLRGSVFAYRMQIDDWFQNRLDRSHIDGIAADRIPSTAHAKESNVCPMCEGSGRISHASSGQMDDVSGTEVMDS